MPDKHARLTSDAEEIEIHAGGLRLQADSPDEYGLCFMYPHDMRHIADLIDRLSRERDTLKALVEEAGSPIGDPYGGTYAEGFRYLKAEVEGLEGALEVASEIGTADRRAMERIAAQRDRYREALEFIGNREWLSDESALDLQLVARKALEEK